MTKKLILFVLLAMIPLVAFADLQLGPSMYYNFPLLGEDTSSSDFSISNFTFGADARLKFWLFQATALALNYLMKFPFNFSDAGNIVDEDKTRGLFGASLLFRLF